jgi:drug/metabolite transporter (DMT)-like permease
VSASTDAPAQRKETLTVLIAMILVSVALAAVAQLTLKAGMNRVTDSSGEVSFSAESLKAVASTPLVWGGLVLFGLSAIAWLFVLSRTSLSFAYPFASLTYLLIVVVDRLVLHEAVPPVRWIGVACIMLGIVLVSRTA